MGWKNLKERFRIEHIVRVIDGNVCIGSSYIPDIIVIKPDGRFWKRYQDRGGNPDLLRYQQEMNADPEAVRVALVATDQFSQSLPVWTYEGGEIIEKHCEEYGWPNLTHDGYLMYNNTHFQDRVEAVREALENAEAGKKYAVERVAEMEDQLSKCRRRVDEYEQNIAKLSATA